MNCIKVFEKIRKDWQKLGFEPSIALKDKVVFSGTIVANDYFDDSVYAEGTLYESGSVHLTLTFDEIEVTQENLELVNLFNINNSWYKAYIIVKNNTNYLELHIAFPFSKNESEMAESISFALNTLLDDETMTNLKPLTERTI